MIYSKLRYHLAFWMVVGLSFGSCSDDSEPIAVTLVTDDGKVQIEVPAGGFQVSRCRVLSITPVVTGADALTFLWSIGDSVISSQKVLDFIALPTGEYPVTLQTTGQDRKKSVLNFTITVNQEEKAYWPYVTAVPEYRPAPGQFINDMPKYEEGDTQAAMNRKALESIGYNTQSLVSLGGFGGYIVCGFDHTIVNVPGQYDFKILANAFYANANPNPDAPEQGGSCEPGIVMVAYDRNKNGAPDDDEWYELAGSEYHKETTVRNYRITYHRPDEFHVPVEAPENETFWNCDAEYIAWDDNQERQGFIPMNTSHRQDYYPKWIEESSMTFQGTLLPNNARDESGTGHYWVLYAYPWGYADNAPNLNELSNFKIDWAMDALGNPVHLPGIDFVKIYTGVNQQCGWLGEISTEVTGINDLHLTK